MNTKSKFRVGDKVTGRTRSWGVITGTVTQVERYFMSVDASGNWEPKGIACGTAESDIKSIQLPHRFDGTTLEVDFPEAVYSTFTTHAHTQRSQFHSWTYTVQTTVPRLGSLLVGMPERKLKLSGPSNG